MQNINHTYKVGTLKQMNIKNRTFYFYNDLIDLESFDSSLLKIGIYNIGYITIKKLMIIEILIVWILCIYVLIIEEKDANKYLIFDSADENKELLKKYNDFLMELKVKSRRYAVMNLIMKKVTWKLNLILMITYH